jgi:hypothetical protein
LFIPGRDPKTGEEIPITASRVMTFRPGQKLGPDNHCDYAKFSIIERMIVKPYEDKDGKDLGERA